MNKVVITFCFWCKKEMNQRVDTYVRQIKNYKHNCCKHCFGKEQSFKDARTRVMTENNPFKGKTHSPEARSIISKKSTGRIAWNFGMRSYKRPTVPGSINKWMEFKRTIMERDCGCCWRCGSKNRIEVHHIISKTRHPEFHYDPNSVITLCYWCHKEFHKEFTIKYFKPQDTTTWLNIGRSEVDKVLFC